MLRKMSKEKHYEMDMCHGPILSKLLLFAIPLMCSSILQLLFNAADIVVVGRFAGDHSLAAVGSNTALINLLVNLFMGLSIGANVLVARFYGAKQELEVRHTVHTTMLLSIYSGILVTIVGVLFARQFLIWMQTPKEVLPLATIYLRIYFLGMTATMIYNFGSAILRAVGDTKRPLYYLMFSGVINVCLNLFFVVILRMDVAGVAAATVISQCISATLVLRCLMHENACYQLHIKELKIQKDKLIKILQIGLPAGFQGIVFALSNVVIQSSINSFGATVVAGNSAAANIEGFVYMSMNAFHQAALSFTGQNYGSGEYKRITRITVLSEMSVMVVGLVFGNLAVLFGHPLLGIYTSSPAVVKVGMARLGVISRTYALCGMMDVLVGVLRGLGYSLLPMFVSLAGACGLRLLAIATLFRLPQFHFIEFLYWLYPITWIITGLVHLACLIWAKRKLPKPPVESY
ncbi:MAG: MATE family efflux transporter [Lachnospiraceae bacterium]